uniref:Uncharacterized protein n=1 Tax=Lactuca sativa TaxID=4236 RepID=A0A9R1VJ91_LACSA|nr:hypothetical protein LSAT_V11C500238800 [Lactuca sativa]
MKYVDFGPCTFCFFNSWMDRKAFANIVAKFWLHFQGYGTFDYILAAKFKHLKNKLKEWRASDFPKEEEDLKKIKSKVDWSDSIAKTIILSKVEQAERRDVSIINRYLGYDGPSIEMKT